ncbi:MAG: helix-turn-helix domain-containing protein [Pseudomonadales bacterium]
MDIGYAIHIIRKQKGLTQETLAAAIDADAGYLSRIENGNRQPSLDLLIRLSDALQAPLSSIFAVAEGGGVGVEIPDGLDVDEVAETQKEILLLRRYFRALPSDRRLIALEILKVMGKPPALVG